jgi:hypothetical protein
MRTILELEERQRVDFEHVTLYVTNEQITN